MYGVIDIGSNTIRLSIYTVEGNKISSLFHKKEVAGLAGYVDEEKNLTNRGIQKASMVLNEFNNVVQIVGVKEVYPFATASLRNINNSLEALHEINAITGLSIEVLSGKEEAILGYQGATLHQPILDGILVDIGGGSTELVFYKDQKIQEALSLPIGSLNAYTRYVSNLIPSAAERRSIETAIKKELNSISNIKAYQNIPVICGVGGTVRGTSKLNNELFNLSTQNKRIPVENLKQILETLGQDRKNTMHTIVKVIPDRIHTIIPGMCILQSLAQYFHSDVITVSETGVREGYLSRVLKEKQILHE